MSLQITLYIQYRIYNNCRKGRRAYSEKNMLRNNVYYIYVLLIIQALLVSLIASLSGRDISLDTAKEFIFSMGGLAGVGYTLRLVAQQGAKFLNAI